MADPFDTGENAYGVPTQDVLEDSPTIWALQAPNPVESAIQKSAAVDVASAKFLMDEEGLDTYEQNYDDAIQSGNPEGARSQLSNRIARQDLDYVRSDTANYVRSLAQSEQDIMDALDASEEVSRRIEERTSSPVKGQRDAVRGVAGNRTSTEELDMAAVDRRIQEDVQSREEDVDNWDYAWSIGREFLTLGMASGFDMAGLVGTKNIFDTQEKLQGEAIRVQAEPNPQRKLALWNELKARAEEELPKADALSFLSQMADASGVAGFQEYQDSTLFWSVVDGATGVGAIAGPGLKSLPKMAKHMGNSRLSGRAAARALEDDAGRVAEKMGANGKREVADDAHPVQTPERTVTREDGEVVDVQESLSVDTQRELQAHRQSVNDSVDNIIAGRSQYLETGRHPNEAARVAQITQTKAARYVESLKGDVQQAIIRNNNDGSITVTSSVVPKGSVGRASSRELEQAGNRLARLEADGFITRPQSQRFANEAQSRGASIESIRAGIADLEEGMSVDDSLRNLDTQAAETFTRTFRATLDETTGSYEQDRLPIGAWARSNRGVSMTPDTVRDFEAAARLDNTSASVARELWSEVDGVFKELPRVGGGRVFSRSRAKTKIQQALVEGDEFVDAKSGEEVGRVWSPDDLRRKYDFTDQEVTAYYKLRNIYDALWKIRNDAVRQELSARGYADITLRRPIQYTGDNGELLEVPFNEVGRPIESAQSARTRLDRAGIAQYYDASRQEMVSASEELATKYAGGQRMVELREHVNIPGVGRVQHIMVDGLREIRDLPTQVLSYKTGYVPRVYDRGVWFVKQTAPFARVDGRMVDSPEVLRTLGMADNEEAARALQRRLATQAEAEGDTAHAYQVFQSDQIDPLELATSGATGSGGRLYTSSRGTSPVPFYKLDGNQLIEEKASRINPFEALQSNINNIAFHYPRNEWRIATTLRLQNTAKKLGVQWNSIHQDATGGTSQANAFINRKRRELRDWLALPDSWETRWQETMQNMYEKALGIQIGQTRPGKVMAPGIWWLKSHDPVTALRAATFHLLLGWFNPVQTFVQMQGFSVALSQAALHGGIENVPRVWRKQSILRSLENAVDDETGEAMARVLRDRGIVEDDEFDQLVELAKVWERSGLREGVLTTGDFKSAGSAMGQGYGALADFANNKGLFFYREGELLARRFSLATSMDDFARRNPEAIRRGLTDDEAKEVISRANDYMLNLGKANKAAWQKGVLSIPTQFWQVQAKLLEQYFTFGAGKVLSTKEKAALALGQIGLYGAAGVPIAGQVGKYYADDPTEFDADSLGNRAFDEGIWGLTFAILGADVEVAERGAILADLQGLVYDFVGGDKSLTELMLGAGNTSMGRFSEAINRVRPFALAAADHEIPTTTEDFVMVADALGDVTSTWSNASKAYLMWKTDTIFSRSGQRLAEDQYSLTTLVASAMGFTPRQESQSYSVATLVRMGEEYRASTKKSIQKYMLDMVQAHEATGRPISEQDAAKFRNTVGYLTGAMNEQESLEMLEEIQQEMMDGDTVFAEATRDYMRVSAQMMLDEALSTFQKGVIGEQAIEEESIR